VAGNESDFVFADRDGAGGAVASHQQQIGPAGEVDVTNSVVGSKTK
jgi:hypothetical protein